MEDFGRAKVFKIAAETSTSGRSSHEEGRILFDGRLTFDALQEKLSSGMRVQYESVDETNEQDWKTKLETVTPLLIITTEGTAVLIEAGSKHTLREGEKIVYLSSPAENG